MTGGAFQSRDDDAPPPPQPSPTYGLARRPPARSGSVENRHPRAPTRPEPPDDDPLDEDIERFSEVTTRCRGCGTELFDDVESCWNCGTPVLGRTETGVPVWVLLTVGVVLAAFLAILLARFW